MDATVYADFDDCVSNVCQNETILIVDSNLSALHSSCVTANLIFISKEMRCAICQRTKTRNGGLINAWLLQRSSVPTSVYD